MYIYMYINMHIYVYKCTHTCTCICIYWIDIYNIKVSRKLELFCVRKVGFQTQVILGCKLQTIKLKAFGAQAKAFWVKTMKSELRWGAERQTQVSLGCRPSCSKHLDLQTIKVKACWVQTIKFKQGLQLNQAS